MVSRCHTPRCKAQATWSILFDSYRGKTPEGTLSCGNHLTSWLTYFNQIPGRTFRVRAVRSPKLRIPQCALDDFKKR